MRTIERALLIDDDHAFRTTMQSALRRRGIRARTAATIQEACIVLEDEPADLIVLDYRLPQVDGLAGLEGLRRRCPEAVIVMLTGFGDIPLAVVAVRKGADLFMTKPVEVDRLLADAKAVSIEARSAGHLPHLPQSFSTLNLEEVERDTITAAMRQSGGIVAQAAKLLGIDRRTLQRKLRKME